MTQPATTRRDVLLFGTSAAAYAAGAAIVTGAVVAASEAKGATGVSPKLLALIATVERREARQETFAEHAYEPASARFRAADEATPHVEVAAPHGARWSTSDQMRVGNARMWTSMDRPLVTTDQREQFEAMQRLVAAHDRRKADVDRLGDHARFTRVWELDNRMSDHVVTAVMAVEAFEPTNLVDLHVKLAYLVPRGWMSDMHGPERMLADVARLIGGEA